MGSLSIWHWLLVILVVVLLFGRGKISDLMGDVAKGIKSFKKGLSEDEATTAANDMKSLGNEAAAKRPRSRQGKVRQLARRRAIGQAAERAMDTNVRLRHRRQRADDHRRRGAHRRRAARAAQGSARRRPLRQPVARHGRRVPEASRCGNARNRHRGGQEGRQESDQLHRDQRHRQADVGYVQQAGRGHEAAARSQGDCAGRRSLPPARFQSPPKVPAEEAKAEAS